MNNSKLLEEISSWSDDEWIFIIHESPELANRLRNLLFEKSEKAAKQINLLPCPFCGGYAKQYDRFNASTVKCKTCGANVRQSEMGLGDAPEKWNRRTYIQPAVQPDRRTPADMLVNGGALILAINVLRRNGKHEVADAIEATAQPIGKVQQDAEDAARYRWLRDLPEGSPHEEIGNFPGDMWDAAIDAAMKEQQP